MPARATDLYFNELCCARVRASGISRRAQGNALHRGDARIAALIDNSV